MRDSELDASSLSLSLSPPPPLSLPQRTLLTECLVGGPFRYAVLVLLFGLAGLGLHGVKTLAGLHVLEHCPKEMVRGADRQRCRGAEGRRTRSGGKLLTDCTVVRWCVQVGLAGGLVELLGQIGAAAAGWPVRRALSLFLSLTLSLSLSDCLCVCLTE